jgi:phenylpropionate dioxygenase-like ring-hydroxylating dioxygenase large terminal subunit
VVPGAVLPLHYFGQELVLFRSEDGQASVLDAHCAHLGAHLGYGGRVDGDCIVCPFHEWKWDLDGTNVEIPNSSRESQRRKMRQWPLLEDAGLIFVWHDPAGGPPQWAPPDLSLVTSVPSDTFVLATHSWPSVDLKPQYVTENMVDTTHLKSVHRAAQAADLVVAGQDEHRFLADLRLGLGVGKESTVLTPDGPVESLIKAVADGVGFTTFQFTGYSDTIYMNGVTPIDDDTSEMRLSVFLPASESDDGHLSNWAIATLREFVKQNERDFEIFKHWKYSATPPFTPEEKGPYLELRKWAGQFYAAEPETVNG